MWLSILGWWRSSNSSNILAIALLAAAFAGYVYISRLQVAAARCEASREIATRYEALSDELDRRIDEDRDDAIAELGETDSPCLSTPMRDLLQDPAAAGELRDTAENDAG